MLTTPLLLLFLLPFSSFVIRSARIKSYVTSPSWGSLASLTNPPSPLEETCKRAKGVVGVAVVETRVGVGGRIREEDKIVEEKGKVVDVVQKG